MVTNLDVRSKQLLGSLVSDFSPHFMSNNLATAMGLSIYMRIVLQCVQLKLVFRVIPDEFSLPPDILIMRAIS